MEWGIAALLVAIVVVVFMKYMREVQAQGEYAAVRTTLGALRTALVIDHLLRHVAPVADSGVAKLSRSPFDLLARHPANYAGVFSGGKAQGVPAGSWVFDPVCPCVGYRPLDDGWLDSPSGDVMAWYQLSGAPGPLQLTARERYRWQDQVLD
ncbi:MAG: hypothetical protein IPN53_15600 [Comamonadaceae bacterium]|nr:hypothetical protein [Comamonadaceae bacterium]